MTSQDRLLRFYSQIHEMMHPQTQSYKNYPGQKQASQFPIIPLSFATEKLKKIKVI
jgi:hypothetical protein